MIELDTNLKRKIIVYLHGKEYTVEVKAWNEEAGEHSDQIHVQKGEGVIITQDICAYSVYQENEENPFIIAEHFVTAKLKIRDFNGIVMIERIK